MIGPEVGRIETIWPTSVGGWVGLAAGTSALMFLIIDRLTARGKNLATISNQIGELCSQVADFEGKLEVVDGLASTVRELVYEWRGVDGKNGYKRIIQENARAIREMQTRNDIVDALKKARDEDDQRSGGMHRRKNELNNLIPEERQEKG